MAKGIWGVIAEFENPARLYEAVGQVQQEGYQKFEAWSPFPIHGIEKPMNLPGSKVPWVTLVGGLTGLSIATLMQWWMGGVDYPVVIGASRYSHGNHGTNYVRIDDASVGVWYIFRDDDFERLTCPNHPLDKYAPFRRVTDDKFFITIEASDPRFDSETAKSFLEAQGGINIAIVEE